MTEYNASDRRDIKRAAKASKAAEAARQLLLLNLMSSPAGRSYMHDLLTSCHVFHTSFTPDSYVTAFREGERNIGLRHINDLMHYCPDLYVTMMREATDKETADGRNRDNDRHLRDSADGGRDDSASSNSGVESDYDPGDGDTIN